MADDMKVLRYLLYQAKKQERNGYLTLDPNKNWFETNKDQEGGSALFRNNKSCKIIGIGTIRLKVDDGTEKILKEVRYIPKLKRNLISFGVFDRNGYSFKEEKENLR